MSLQPGQKLGPYAILSSLGAGGMGEVYLADDTRLGRQVAVKVLPEQVLQDQARRRRFLREARAAASVDHPNVVHVYDVGELPDGLVYLVMQHVAGETIRKLLMEDRLETDRALTLAAEVADALSTAHQKGVIHRDIKPDNIMVDPSGHARVLDFGLARLLQDDPAGEAPTQVATVTRKTTTEGSVLGTMAYMSPEQARGGEVDGRSDIFSLGVTLYEMLTRRHPFAGRTEVETVDSLLNREPQPVGSLVGGLPSETEWVVSKMMAKRPEDRYQSAGDLQVDLRKLRHTTSVSGARPAAEAASEKRPAWLVPALGAMAVLAVITAVVLMGWPGSGPGDEASSAGVEVKGPSAFNETDAPAAASAAPKIRLAVLPLQNVSGGESVDYLGFALADATISKLSYLNELTVRPSSFIQRYRDNPPEDPQQVGRDLNVDHLLTGSLFTQGDVVRVNVQFVDLDEGAVRWEETIDSTVDNLLELQDEVVSRIVDRMRLKVSPEERAGLSRDESSNSQAFDLYLRSVSQPSTPAGTDEALRLLERSLALEPDFAPAWVDFGRRKYDRALYSPEGEPADYQEALEALRRAEQLNPDSPRMIHYLVVMLTERGQHQEAYRKISAWLERHPRDAGAHFALSYLFRYTGLLEEAAREADTALALDPGNPFFRSGGTVYAYMGNLERAESFYSLDEGSTFNLVNRFAAYAINGSRAGLKGLLEEEVGDRHAEEILGEYRVAYARDEMEEARKEMQSLIESLGLDDAQGLYSDTESMYSLAASAASVGLVSPALGILGAAVETGFYCTPLMERDQRLDGIRAEPEFQKILSRARQRTGEFREFVKRSG